MEKEMGMGVKNEYKFEYSDPWLLLSIIYAQQHGKGDLVSIIGYGDFINHAIFSLKEMQGGMYRLIQAGYVIEKEDGFLPADKIVIPYKKFRAKKHSVEEDLQFIRVKLSAPEWSSDYDLSLASQSERYKGISQESFERAYQKYAQEHKV